MQYLEIFDSESTVRAMAITPQDLMIWYEISVNAAILYNRLLADLAFHTIVPSKVAERF